MKYISVHTLFQIFNRKINDRKRFDCVLLTPYVPHVLWLHMYLMYYGLHMYLMMIITTTTKLFPTKWGRLKPGYRTHDL